MESGVWLEVTGVTMAGSLSLRLLSTTDVALFWLTPLLWMCLPLLPLLRQRLPLSSHGYSIRQWTGVPGRLLVIELSMLLACAMLVGGWRLLTGGQPILPQYAISFETILVQLMLVAMPEELFFRGYAQERLRHWAEQRGLPQQPSAILLGAVLFTLAHVMVMPSWRRAAVFFPGCVMGWLRARSQGLLASTLFHWLANLLALSLDF